MPSYARLFFLLFVKLLHKFYKILTIIALGTYEKKSFKWIEKFEVIAFVVALSAIFFPSFAQLHQANFIAPKKITTTSIIYTMTISTTKDSGDNNL